MCVCVCFVYNLNPFVFFPAPTPGPLRYIDTEPVFLAMTSYHVIVASKTNVYVWQYRTPVSKLTSVSAPDELIVAFFNAFFLF